MLSPYSNICRAGKPRPCENNRNGAPCQAGTPDTTYNKERNRLRSVFAEAGDHGDGRKFDDLLFADFLGIDVILVFAQVKQADGFHNFWDIDSPGAANHALMAGCAKPGGVGCGDIIEQTEAGQEHQFTRADVHGILHGAGAGAGSALHTDTEILAADFFDFADEVKADIFIINFFSHVNPCIVSVINHKVFGE